MMDDSTRYTDLSGASRARPRQKSSEAEKLREEARAANRRALVNRLSRIEGHVRSIKRMVEEDRNANQILTQVAAVKAAINKFSSTMLTMELDECISEPERSRERLDRIAEVLGTLLKQT